MERPRTAYVRRQVLGKPWSERHEIENMIFLEEMILNGPASRGQADIYFGLRGSEKYGPHYRAIRDELEPGWRAEEERKAAEEAARKTVEVEMRSARERVRRQLHESKALQVWLEFGGKTEPGL